MRYYSSFLPPKRLAKKSRIALHIFSKKLSSSTLASFLFSVFSPSAVPSSFDSSPSVLSLHEKTGGTGGSSS